MELELESQGMDLRVLSTAPATTATFARTGTTVTVTLAAHGRAVGDRIEVVTSAAGGLAGERVTVTSVAAGGFVFTSEATGDVPAATALTFLPLLSVAPKTIQGPGGAAAVIDATTLVNKAKRKRMGLADEGQVNCTVHYVPGNLAHETLRTARKARKAVQLELAFADEPTTYWSFEGYVLSFPVTAGVDALVESAVSIEVNGEITEY